jgi:hypothetical protein
MQPRLTPLAGLIGVVLVAAISLPYLIPNGVWYRSEATLAGLPLVDIRWPSRDQMHQLKTMPPAEALDRVSARGWFACGTLAFGVASFGVLSVGAFSAGVGVVGLFAAGTVAVALVRSVGCVALAAFQTPRLRLVSDSPRPNPAG